MPFLISSIHVNIVDWTDRFSFEKEVGYVRSIMFKEFLLGIFNGDSLTRKDVELWFDIYHNLWYK